MAAYQKYGDDFLNSSLVVNHRDNNTLNNKEDNIIMVLPSGRTKNENYKISSMNRNSLQEKLELVEEI